MNEMKVTDIADAFIADVKEVENPMGISAEISLNERNYLSFARRINNDTIK